MKKLIILTMALIATIGIFNAKAQNNAHGVRINIPEHALLDLETDGDAIVLTPTAPTEPGLNLSFTSAIDESTWINYSSIVAASNARTVSAQITSADDVPTGLQLTVLAAGYSGIGKGNKGSSTGEVILSQTSARPVINNIRSSWTGTGANNGHKLTYQLNLVDADQYGNLANADTDLTITYTISDDSVITP